MTSEVEPINNEQTQTRVQSDDGGNNANGKGRNRNRRNKTNPPTDPIPPKTVPGKQDLNVKVEGASAGNDLPAGANGTCENERGKKSKQNRNNKNQISKPKDAADQNLLNGGANGKQGSIVKVEGATAAGNDLLAGTKGGSENSGGKKSNQNRRNNKQKPKTKDVVDQNFQNDGTEIEGAMKKQETAAPAANEGSGDNGYKGVNERKQNQKRNRGKKDPIAKKDAHVLQNASKEKVVVPTAKPKADVDQNVIEGAMKKQETSAPAANEGSGDNGYKGVNERKQNQKRNRGKKDPIVNQDAQVLQEIVKEEVMSTAVDAGFAQEGSANSKKKQNQRNKNKSRNASGNSETNQIPSNGSIQIEKQDIVAEEDAAAKAVVEGGESSGQNQRKRNRRIKGNRNKNTAETGDKSLQIEVAQIEKPEPEAAETVAENTSEKNGKNKRNRRNNGKGKVHAATEDGQPQPTVNTPTEDQDQVTEMINNTTSTTSPNDQLALSLHQFSTTKFSAQSSISSPTKRALSEVLRYEMMTKVQEATLPSIMQGKDVVAKAKTGSGKTIAFLLPILERLSSSATRGDSNSFVTAVVISPTRELTQQITAEFVKLSTFHSSEKTVYMSMIGGTSIDKDKRALASKKNLRMIVTTPGRLLDHLKQNTANLVERMSRVQILCLDEADRLLDMGFREDLKAIIAYMPASHDAGERQTLLFSATFPDSLKDMTDVAMKANHEFIDTLDENESHTNVQVMQKSVVVPLHHHILAMHEIIQSHIRKCTSNGQKYKCIAFFTTARIAGFMSELFLARWPEHYSPKNLWEIHSRKSQSHRINVAKQFTAGDNCILFSSDVSARGVDYPNVSFVLQVGAPSEKAQYIHRLGRTARAGQAGEGVLMLCDFERVFMKEVEDLEISPLTTPAILQEQVQQEQQCLRQLLESNERLKASGASAYQAFLGYYNSNMRRLKLQSKQELVLIANEYATMIGFPEGQPPALLAKTVGKMQLKDVAGIRIDRGGSAERGGRGRNSNRGRGGRGVKTLR